MPFFTYDDFAVFTPARTTDPAYDAARGRVREKLLWLNQQIYPQIRERGWGVRLPRVPNLLFADGTGARRDVMRLGYTKAETVLKLMTREFGAGWGEPTRQAMLGVRVDARGLAVELFVGDAAVADGQNLKRKLQAGAPDKRYLRQLCAELGGAFALTLTEAVPDDITTFGQREILRARCSRLVNLGVLDAALARYLPGAHELIVAASFAPDDPRLEADALANQIVFRLGQLYPLYDLLCWSPRNNYLKRASAELSANNPANLL